MGLGLANATQKCGATLWSVEWWSGCRPGLLQRILDLEAGSEMGTDQWGPERPM